MAVLSIDSVHWPRLHMRKAFHLGMSFDRCQTKTAKAKTAKEKIAKVQTAKAKTAKAKAATAKTANEKDS